MSLLSEFRDFITKGNIVDLAVAVVIGVAFNALVMSMVTDLVTPLIGVAGHYNFSAIKYTVNGSTFLVGTFLNQIISFIIISAVVFFLLVKPAHHLMDANKKKEEAKTKACPYCLQNIPIKAVKCMYCTSDVKT